MISITCWGCGWEGNVADGLAGRKAICRRCRTVNDVPEPATREDFPVVWRDAIDPNSQSKTDELDIRGWPYLST